METKIGYALFTVKNGNLYPQYVKAKEPTPIGVWTEAREDATRWTNPKNGRDYVDGGKLGWLAWRPGKHLALVPLFNHIGKRQPDGTLARRKDSAICEVEFVANHDWTDEAKERCIELYGKEISRDCCLDHLPYDGFYYYKTNANAKVPWIICHKFRINRVLDEAEIVDICQANGYEAQKMERR